MYTGMSKVSRARQSESGEHTTRSSGISRSTIRWEDSRPLIHAVRAIASVSSRGINVNPLPPLRRSEPSRNRQTALDGRDEERKTVHHTLHSAALQDHFVKSMQLKSLDTAALPSYRKSITIPTQKHIQLQSLDIRKRQRQKWERERDKSPRKLAGLEPRESSSTPLEKVLDSPGPSLTLAQRLGILPRPPSRLSDHGWNVAKTLSKERDDSNHPCPICQEPFRTEEQVLLSCSHVFHRSCIQSYERYVHKKICPLCRQANYEKRLIFEGLTQHKKDSAVKIQKTWRMYYARKKYRVYRREHPPSDPKLLTHWHMDKLESYNSLLEQQVKSESLALDKFLRDLDMEVEQSRCTIRGDSAGTSDETLLQLKSLRHDWDKIFARASDEGRLEDDCAICITPLWADRPIAASSVADKIPRRKVPARALTLLSCSHLYHAKCLQCLEKFDNNIHTHVCPICRATYERILV
ncbi:hypothetical protein DFS34DRAFT_33254 [Phlyctochytrium arcticum]|nr:hypothetical protein DFS34DRAFT_33254 [Phlyctochytrium arcticum]